MLPHQQYAGVVRTASKRCSVGRSGFIKLQVRVDRGLIIEKNLSSACASNTKAAIAWVTVLRHQTSAGIINTCSKRRANNCARHLRRRGNSRVPRILHGRGAVDSSIP